MSFSVKGDYSCKLNHLLENAPRILLIEKFLGGSSTRKGGIRSICTDRNGNLLQRGGQREPGTLLYCYWLCFCSAVIYAWLNRDSLNPIWAECLQQNTTDPAEKKMADFPTVADLDISGKEYYHQIPKKNLFALLYLPPKLVKFGDRCLHQQVTRAVNNRSRLLQLFSRCQSEPIQPLDVLGQWNKAGDYTVFF